MFLNHWYWEAKIQESFSWDFREERRMTSRLCWKLNWDGKRIMPLSSTENSKLGLRIQEMRWVLSSSSQIEAASSKCSTICESLLNWTLLAYQRIYSCLFSEGCRDYRRFWSSWGEGIQEQFSLSVKGHSHLKRCQKNNMCRRAVLGEIPEPQQQCGKT